jgi:hypothetical protein
MDYLETVLEQLAATQVAGYHAGGHAAAEPTALVALALLAHGRDAAAQRHVDRLLELQGPDGGVGIEPAQKTPAWPTGLAVLAWRAAQMSKLSDKDYVTAIDSALHWILATKGTLLEHVRVLQHDTMLLGWPWVVGTHSWVEPTAVSLLALKHSRFARHSRARQAVRLLVNRLLESGGCNYGNTIVFGQELRPHLQPTGICLLALAGEADTTGRIGRSVDYLDRELSENTATASLCYGLLGLAAQGAFPERADHFLQAAAQRTLDRDASPYKMALLALAAQGPECPLIARVRSFDSEKQPR